MDTGDFRYAPSHWDMGTIHGNVGPGTTTPAVPLHIVANSKIRSVLYLTNDVIRIESPQPMPSRWVCWWHRFLLGWRWEKPL